MTSGMVIRTASGSLGDFRTEVVQSGDGSAGTVLALHSLGLDAHAFDALRAALGHGWRVVAFDQRGHGRSAAYGSDALDVYVNDAAAMLARLGEGPVHLLGHSMGGAVAALLAARTQRTQARRIVSLALVSSPAQGGALFGQRGDAVLAGGVPSAIVQTMARWFGEAAALQDASQQAYARAALSAMTPGGMARAWRALGQFQGYAGLVRDLPATLCVAAADDLSTPPQVMQGIADAFAAAGLAGRCRSATLTRGGHMAPLFADPALVGALTAHWLQHAAHAAEISA